MKRHNTQAAPDDLRAQLNALIDKNGMKWARITLDISEHALARAAGGLTVQRGTIAYLAQQVAKIGAVQ